MKSTSQLWGSGYFSNPHGIHGSFANATWGEQLWSTGCVSDACDKALCGEPVLPKKDLSRAQLCSNHIRFLWNPLYERFILIEISWFVWLKHGFILIYHVFHIISHCHDKWIYTDFQYCALFPMDFQIFYNGLRTIQWIYITFSIMFSTTLSQPSPSFCTVAVSLKTSMRRWEDFDQNLPMFSQHAKDMWKHVVTRQRKAFMIYV